MCIDRDSSFSEAVIVYFNTHEISQTLIEIHLHTHKSSNHSMRTKYRSVLYFSEVQRQEVVQIITKSCSKEINNTSISISNFAASRAEITNYYYKNPKKPFARAL
jgi:peptide-methionine (S)-S-oxide reductase